MIGVWYFLVALFWAWVVLATFCLLACASMIVGRWIAHRRTIHQVVAELTQ